jgi:hypothetical protein
LSYKTIFYCGRNWERSNFHTLTACRFTLKLYSLIL